METLKIGPRDVAEVMMEPQMYIGAQVYVLNGLVQIRNTPVFFQNFILGSLHLLDKKCETILFPGEHYSNKEYLSCYIDTNCGLRGCTEYVEEVTNRLASSSRARTLPNWNFIQLMAVCTVVRCISESQSSSYMEKDFGHIFVVAGPAGTGETNAIIQMISATPPAPILSDPLVYYERMRRQGSCGMHSDEKRAYISPGTKIRLLVLAPTHGALQNIEKKLTDPLMIQQVDGNDIE